MFPDGNFIILCQFISQSYLLSEADEIHVDKTFKRTHCQELEINTYSHTARRIATIARVYTDLEDELGYYRAFDLVFKTAERDTKQMLPWGHLIPPKPGTHRIKAILVDEHGGQAKGLGRYFAEQYPDMEAVEHIVAIVKTCQVHIERNLKKLETKGVEKGNYLLEIYLIYRALRSSSLPSTYYF